jgi:hypothetical protein
MVHLQHVYEDYKKRGVVILGFNSADDPKIARKFLREKRINFPNILDSSRAAQDVAARTYKGSGVPLNYIIDRDGSTGPSSVVTMSGKEVEPGIYEIPLAVGEQEVSAWTEGFRCDPVKVTIREGKTVERKLQLVEIEG